MRRKIARDRDDRGSLLWRKRMGGVCGLLHGDCGGGCFGIILKKTPMFQGETSPLVMELPAYRLPSLKAL